MFADLSSKALEIYNMRIYKIDLNVKKQFNILTALTSLLVTERINLQHYNKQKQFNSCQNIKYKILQQIQRMAANYKRLMTSQHIPGKPSVNYDTSRKALLHVYQNIPLQTSNFQSEVNYYLNRKQSYSGNVATVHKIKDEHITINLGQAAMEISVVTDYIPWRLHLEPNTLNYEQALYLLNGACKGFRQLLHRVRSPFMIQSNMIGVDVNGEVKVWWNSLFCRSNFGFTMSSQVKLRDMIRSLIQSILNKTNKDDASKILALIGNADDTFVGLQEKIRQLTCNFNFKSIGKNLISTKQEYLVAIKECGINTIRNSSIVIDPLRLSSVSHRNQIASTERVIISPRKQQQRLQFNPKIVTKRTYRGVSPTFQQKIKTIKEDIQNLRAVVEPNKLPSSPISSSQVKLRSSRSVENIFSYKKGITGNANIPEVSKAIKESGIIGEKEDLTISRFVEPISKSSTEIQEHCGVCNSLQELRKSQIASNDPLFLSRVQNVVGTEKSINSTSRSMNESHLSKYQNNSESKTRFGESEKKLPESVYFTSLLQM